MFSDFLLTPNLIVVPEVGVLTVGEVFESVLVGNAVVVFHGGTLRCSVKLGLVAADKNHTRDEACGNEATICWLATVTAKGIAS